MLNKLGLFEKCRTINYNTPNDNCIKDDDILNDHQYNKSANFFISTFTNKDPDINKSIKPFNILVGEYCPELQSNIFSSDLRFYNLGNNNNDNDKYYEHNNNKANHKFIIKKTKRKRPKQSSIGSNDKNKHIFSIKKVLKLGRKKKTSIKKGKHDKNKRDNIIRKFKVHLIQNIYEYINSLFKINNRCIRFRKIIKKVSSQNTKLISKKDNIQWLNSSVKNIFSQNITTKYSTYNSDYNKKMIDLIYKENEEIEVINILNKTIRDMWLVYINDDAEKSYNGFSTLKDDIKKLREMGESESYIKRYISVANKFEDIFDGIISRK